MNFYPCNFSISLDAPEITHISNDQIVNEGDEVTLNCIADGNPEPRITWTRVSDKSVITFPLTTKEQDEGYYRCTADNGIGRPVTSDVLIVVSSKCFNQHVIHKLILSRPSGGGGPNSVATC